MSLIEGSPGVRILPNKYVPPEFGQPAQRLFPEKHDFFRRQGENGRVEPEFLVLFFPEFPIEAIARAVRLNYLPTEMSATISMAAISDLGLAVGGEAYAIVKATSVMIGVD